MAYGDHPSLSIDPGDTVIISAKPVPGNELRVHDSINQLARAGAEVLHEEIAPVHVSGHACQEELRTMLSLLRPRHVMLIDGEYRMLAAHAKLAREAGVPEDRILLAENGSWLSWLVEVLASSTTCRPVSRSWTACGSGTSRTSRSVIAAASRTTACSSSSPPSGSSDGGEIAPPELIARGFAEDDELLEELRVEADRVVRELSAGHTTEIKLLQEHIHDAVGQIVYDRTRRRPMILPVVIEV